MESRSFQVRFAMLTSMDGVYFHEDFVVGHVAGSSGTQKKIMYYMDDKDMTANTMKRLVKTMQDLAINKVDLVVEKDITPVAKLCLSSLQPRYQVEVVMASDLIAQGSRDHALRNFPTRAMTIAKEMMAKDGEIDAKDFYIRVMKGQPQRTRELAKSILHAFIVDHFTVYDYNNKMKLKVVEHTSCV